MAARLRDDGVNIAVSQPPSAVPGDIFKELGDTFGLHPATVAYLTGILKVKSLEECLSQNDLMVTSLNEEIAHLRVTLQVTVNCDAFFELWFVILRHFGVHFESILGLCWDVLYTWFLREL